MAYCHRCGVELGTATNFCPECGADLRTDDGAASELAATTEGFQGRTWVNALIGGTVGFILGMMVASAFALFYVVGIMVGGVVAGYLQAQGTGAGAKAGALSGLLSTAPVIFLLFVVTVLGVGTVLFSVGRQFMPMDPALAGPGLLLVLLGLFLVLATLTNVVFGAFGGFVGGALLED